MVHDPDKTPLAPASGGGGGEAAIVSEEPGSLSVLPAGTVLDRYELLFELARGGMGRVYVARHVGAHDVSRLVAIKRLESHVRDADSMQAFFREARIAARVSHPNVVQTHELGEHDGSPFIVMQLVQGVSLGMLLARLSERGESIDPDLAAWIVSQSALGLHAAHELAVEDGSPLNVVHRDVSPQNVLLSFDGRPYVVDFGIAKLAHTDTATGSGVVKGKFAYMSPEQAQAMPLDRRSDIFSLGILLHEAITGERLFEAGTPAETVVRIIHSPVTPPKRIRPDVGDGLNDIVMRCLEKEPSLRYQTAADLAQALRDDLRSRGSAVDELDVAELLQRKFPGDQAALSDRIRRSWLMLDEARGRGAVQKTSVPGRTTGRGALVVLGMIVAVLISGALWWAQPWHRSAPQSAIIAVPDASASLANASVSTTPHVAQPEASASAVSATPEMPSSTAATSTRTGPKPGRVRPQQDAGAPVIAPPSASYRGVPFNSL